MREEVGRSTRIWKEPLLSCAAADVQIDANLQIHAGAGAHRLEEMFKWVSRKLKAKPAGTHRLGGRRRCACRTELGRAAHTGYTCRMVADVGPGEEARIIVHLDAQQDHRHNGLGSDSRRPRARYAQVRAAAASLLSH